MPFIRAAIMLGIIIGIPTGLRMRTATHTENTIVIVNNNMIVQAATVEEAPAEKLPVEPTATAVSDEIVTSDEEVDTPLKEVSVNGSTIWATYVRTPEQREVQAIVKKIAKKHSVNWKMAYGICLKESRCNRYLDCSAQTGHCDYGQSFGSWQIYRPWDRNISVDDAKNFEWSTEWSIVRLKRHESLGEFEQIRSHNGLYSDNRNVGYVEDVKKLMSLL